MELLELIKVQLAVAVSVVVLHQRLCVRHKVRVGDVQAELSQHVQQLTLLELPGPVGVKLLESRLHRVRGRQHLLAHLLALVHRLNLRRCVVLNNGRQRTSHQPANSLLQLLSVRRPGLLRHQTLRMELLELIKVQLAVAVSVVVLHQRLCVRHKVRVGDVQAELSQHVQQLTLLELPGPVGVESVECFPDGVRVCHRARHPWSPSVVVSYPTLPLNWELQMSHSSDEDCSPLALVLARERRFLTVCDSTNRSGARAAGCHGRHRPRAASSVR